jgi:subtilisin family serine protease
MKYKGSLFILVIGILCVFKASSQDSWIVQLKEGQTSSDFSNWNKGFLRSKKIEHRLLASHFNIIEVTGLSRQDLLSNPSVLFAEKNVKLEMRASPNDPLVAQQWYLNNINALKAWDQTTGGITFNKDTLVLAAIDHGFLTTHEDLKNRIWKNHAEIGGNGKDDDNNGYIDDVNGLSLRYKNEKHSIDNTTDGLSNHGTSVAGIMCGESNNKTGISGMMWNSKLMLTTFSANGNIADLIEMFNYVLDQRLRYNQSNGKQGALVVAINYSGGISFAKAADYPIWCGMYDKMGAAGIINCGATTNKYVDVDDEGDMPSTCPSEFLIAVTNTDRNNSRVYNAGFGLKNIDLGSPGEGLQTTRSDASNSYSSFSGTSAATPVVAGAVGLMYSLQCKEWADYIKSNPVEAARIVKKSLLASVDRNADLTGKTVSGGRLNIGRALDTLKKYVCGRTITSVKQELNIKAISPNPASTYINIQLDSNQYGEYDFTLFDITGKSITKQKIFINQNITIPLPDIASGTYLLHLKNQDKIAIAKIMVSAKF